MQRTRSGVLLESPHTLRDSPLRARQTKSPRPRKPKKPKIKAEKKVAKLDKPLSELTKSWKHLPVADIEAFVNRPVEERRKEVVGKKVKRPMNSFILYRKAYQNRTKDWALQNNHQVVSQVCGESWHLEPEEVRDQFIEWARIERINHRNAYPAYKFQPTKAASKEGAGKSSKRKVGEDSDTEESELDEMDQDWMENQSKRTKKTRPSPQRVVQASPAPYSFSRVGSQEPGQNGPITSSYHHNNPGRPVPAPYDQSGLHAGQYYQSTVHQNSAMPGTEDVVIRRTACPGMHHLGLPGGAAYEYEQQYQYYEDTPAPEQQKIDPSLLPYSQGANDDLYNDPDSVYFGDNYPGNLAGDWQASYGASDREMSTDFHNSSQHFEDASSFENAMTSDHNTWQVEQIGNNDFEEWVGGSM